MFWEKIDMDLVNCILHRRELFDILVDWHPTTYTLAATDRIGNRLFKIRVPYFFEYDPAKNIFAEKPICNIALVLIKAGTASVGVFENKTLSSHKVFRAYMVRKKQGKSQIKYLKTKGKSRAGSRVRLQETIEFFAKINERLIDIEAAYHLERIGVSCSKTLWPYLFQGKIKPPFSKNDLRLFSIPFHIPQATHLSLLRAHQHLSTGRVLVQETFRETFQSLKPTNENPAQEDFDNW